MKKCDTISTVTREGAGAVSARDALQRRLTPLGLILPEAPAPVAAYVPALRVGKTVTTSGQLPFIEGKLPVTGKVTADSTTGGVSLKQAAELAQQCALNALAAAAAAAEEAGEITGAQKVTVFVASETDFTDQALVANGASLLLGEIFGESGVHTRSAVGVAVLPLDSPVEAEFVFELS